MAVECFGNGTGVFHLAPGGGWFGTDGMCLNDPVDASEYPTGSPLYVYANINYSNPNIRTIFPDGSDEVTYAESSGHKQMWVKWDWNGWGGDVTFELRDGTSVKARRSTHIKGTAPPPPPEGLTCYGRGMCLHIGSCCEFSGDHGLCVCNPVDASEYPTADRLWIAANTPGFSNPNIRTVFDDGYEETHYESGEYMWVYWDMGGWGGGVKFELRDGTSVKATRSTHIKGTAPPPPPDGDGDMTHFTYAGDPPHPNTEFLVRGTMKNTGSTTRSYRAGVQLAENPTKFFAWFFFKNVAQGASMSYDASKPVPMGDGDTEYLVSLYYEEDTQWPIQEKTFTIKPAEECGGDIVAFCTYSGKDPEPNTEFRYRIAIKNTTDEKVYYGIKVYPVGGDPPEGYFNWGYFEPGQEGEGSGLVTMGDGDTEFVVDLYGGMKTRTLCISETFTIKAKTAPPPDLCKGVVCNPDCFGTDLHDTVCNPDTGLCVKGVLIMADSSDCGYVPPDPEPDPDLCDGVVCHPDCFPPHDLHETVCDEGVCIKGVLIEADSSDCGYVPPDPEPDPDLCDGVVCHPDCFPPHDLHETVCDEGVCIKGVLIEADSSDCGYVPPDPDLRKFKVGDRVCGAPGTAWTRFGECVILEIRLGRKCYYASREIPKGAFEIAFDKEQYFDLCGGDVPPDPDPDDGFDWMTAALVGVAVVLFYLLAIRGD